MSLFLKQAFRGLIPYTPGEQPQDQAYIKLNTNESPFPPSSGVVQAAKDEAKRLQLYSDPDCKALTKALAKSYGISEQQVVLTNGSDEVLELAFMAFADEIRPLVFPDITYGFYAVFANLLQIPYTEIPLTDDFSIDVTPYLENGKTVVIANPNAPTGRFLPLSEIERILQINTDGVVIVDEAYVDFGAQSAVTLVDKYPNLLVTQTFSKSRSMAGARLGFGIGSAELIADLQTVRYSTNPYNVNRMTAAAGCAALAEQTYYTENCNTIMKNRTYTVNALEQLGFTVLPSMANFVFAKTPKMEGGALYRALKQRGILVRHFEKERIRAFNRITIGTREQMKTLIETVAEILKEEG